MDVANYAKVQGMTDAVVQARADMGSWAGDITDLMYCAENVDIADKVDTTETDVDTLAANLRARYLGVDYGTLNEVDHSFTDIYEPERIAAKDKVYEIVRTTAEYMRQMETAPALKADGLEDGYKVLADFNGTVLAGVQSKHGVHFVTWDWAYGHTGVCHGHYFMENYAGAKQDFAIRSGLIQKERLFTPEQMTEIYRCCADSVDGDFFELTGEQEKMIRSVQQQIEECVPDLDERIRQQEEALEQATQEQTM